VLPPLFLTEFDLDVQHLAFQPNVEDFHEVLGDVITRFVLRKITARRHTHSMVMSVHGRFTLTLHDV